MKKKITSYSKWPFSEKKMTVTLITAGTGIMYLTMTTYPAYIMAYDVNLQILYDTIPTFNDSEKEAH